MGPNVPRSRDFSGPELPTRLRGSHVDRERTMYPADIKQAYRGKASLKYNVPKICGKGEEKQQLQRVPITVASKMAWAFQRA